MFSKDFTGTTFEFYSAMFEADAEVGLYYVTVFGVNENGVTELNHDGFNSELHPVKALRKMGYQIGVFSLKPTAYANKLVLTVKPK